MPRRLKYTVARLVSLLFITFFLAVLFLPSLTHLSGNFDQDYIVATEKRRPNEMPAFPAEWKDAKAYCSRLDAYLADHFGFRSRLINTNNLLRYALGVSASEKVLIGKKKWLYYTNEGMVEQYRGIQLFDDDELAAWVGAMEARRKWLAERNILFAIAVAPNKMTIYPENLPNWVTKVGVRSQFDQVVDAVRTQGRLRFIDLRPALLAAKKRYPLYYQTDSHWNFHGAYIGYQAIVEQLAPVMPNLALLGEEQAGLHFVPGRGMDLAAMLNIADQIDEPNNDATHILGAQQVSRTDLATDGSRFVMRGGREHAPRALVFRDSFTDLLIPYLGATFSECLYVQNDNESFDRELIEQFKPDVVLHIIVERGLRYLPYNIDAQGLFIKNWGPRQARLGESFNTLPNGQSAIWLVSDKITPGTVIYWEGTPLPTTVVVEQGVATATVPSSFFDRVASYPIYLYDEAAQLKSNTVMFQVYR